MAELVDALVSNTNAARRAGSIPALGTSHTTRNKSLSPTRDLAIFLFHYFTLFIVSSYLCGRILHQEWPLRPPTSLKIVGNGGKKMRVNETHLFTKQ